jgi:metal-responsive CopG/Arc/MetJ family transcriptional regulator
MAKVMISIPDALLGELDAEAAWRGQTRSGVIQDAVRRELGRLDPTRFDATLAVARAALVVTRALSSSGSSAPTKTMSRWQARSFSLIGMDAPRFA